MTKTQVQKMGYRKLSENRYGKRRKIRGGQASVFVGLEFIHKFRWDVHAVESDGSINWSQAETVKHLKEWEAFAIVD